VGRHPLREHAPQRFTPRRLAPLNPKSLGGQVHKIQAPGQLIPLGVRKLNACTNEFVRENVPQRATRNGCGKIGGARESPNVSAVLAYQERVGALRNVIQQSQGRSFLMPVAQLALKEVIACRTSPLGKLLWIVGLSVKYKMCS
jgi:hypothetical protein